jgi:hypothetical protein
VAPRSSQLKWEAGSCNLLLVPSSRCDLRTRPQENRYLLGQIETVGSEWIELLRFDFEFRRDHNWMSLGDYLGGLKIRKSRMLNRELDHILIDCFLRDKRWVLDNWRRERKE